MAKTKPELLAEAKKLKLKVTLKNTVAEITAAIAGATAPKAVKAKVAKKAGETVAAEEKAEKPLAKAGKRSEKSLKEAEEKAEKEARKEAGDTTPVDEDGVAIIKRGPKPITRPRSERRGKAYRKAYELVDITKSYTLAEAVELATKTSVGKFDSSVELHINLGVDPRQADQNIRQTVSLPHGTGKTVRVAVFAPSDAHAAAKKAGADIVGEDEFLKQLDKELLDFEVLISTPQLMPKLGKYARLLGPRGLMPNPKSGTVTTNVAKAVEEAKAGRVEYRVDKQSIVHLSIGKVSFGPAKVADNAKAFFDSLTSSKPSSLKGTFIKSISMSTTMGPGIKIDTNSL